MIFAYDCEADGRIKFYVKLPAGFKMPTPIRVYPTRMDGYIQWG